MHLKACWDEMGLLDRFLNIILLLFVGNASGMTGMNGNPKSFCVLLINMELDQER